MDEAPALRTLLLWVIYPIWLFAGALDWWCHRSTHIEATSGTTESWLHLLQFLSLGAFLSLALLLDFSVFSAAAIIATVLVHTVLSFIDVHYTLPRRHISALEQHVHGFLDVLPWVACALWILMNLHMHDSGTNAWRVEGQGTLLLLISYAVLAGVPVIVELRRTLRPRSLANDA
jgi:hypothetical protein